MYCDLCARNRHCIAPSFWKENESRNLAISAGRGAWRLIFSANPPVLITKFDAVRIQEETLYRYSYRSLFTDYLHY